MMLAKKNEMFISDDSRNAVPADPPAFSGESYSSSPILDVDLAAEKQSIQGFGISFTDASCYMLSKLTPERRAGLLEELFSPEELNLSIGRLNVGPSDYATRIYSYDDTPDDVEMKDFSIAHDRQYIIPAVLETQKIRPDIFWFASPWSPPAWMKAPRSMCGGYMRQKYLPAFANYLTEYLKAYRDAGIDVRAVTIQNEPGTTQGGTMPQSLLHPDFEMELVAKLMPERLKANGLDPQLWIHDHTYRRWPRVLYMLQDAEVRSHAKAVAWHPYSGTPEMIAQVKDAFPDIDFHLTEKGPNHNPGSPESRISWWGQTISGALNNFCRSFTGWNLALDELGRPNLGNFNCAGLVTIDSVTSEISYSVQYHAFNHFSPYFRAGAVILDCPANYPPEYGVYAVVGRNVDGSHAAVFTNVGDKMSCIQLKKDDRFARIVIYPGSVITLTF